MAAALIAETTYDVSPNLGGKVLKFKVTKVTTADWVVFDVPVGVVVVNQSDGTVDTVSYANCDTTDDADGVLTDASTDVTVTYDNVGDATELPSTNGYIMLDNEIIKYTAGGGATSGTFTGLKRGCFGTTIAAHTQNKTGYILNTVVLGDSITGLCRGIADVIEE